MLLLGQFNGSCEKFNLNLLHRINRELKADFDPAAFYHYPEYDEETGTARSCLDSSKDQQAKIGAIPLMASFKKDYFDKRGYFLNSLFEMPKVLFKMLVSAIPTRAAPLDLRQLLISSDVKNSEIIVETDELYRNYS